MHPDLSEHLRGRIRQLLALQLWQLGAIKVNLAEPFRLVSGNFSPIYINCRQLISFPAFADLFAAGARIACQQGQIEFDVIAGGETAGIPFAAFLARSLGRPMVYVRKQTKAHGMASRVEGLLEADQRVLLVEDLITDAGSKLSFVEAIRQSGGVVRDVLVLFDRLQGGAEALACQGIRLHALTDMDEALAVAGQTGLLSQEELGSIGRYLADPRQWHQQRGLAFTQ